MEVKILALAAVAAGLAMADSPVKGTMDQPLLACGAGRAFFTSFGHDKRAFIDKPRLLHMLAGLQYCLGDLDCPDTP